MFGCLALREKIMLERASIAGGATVAVVLVVIISIIFYTYVRQQKKEQRLRYNPFILYLWNPFRDRKFKVFPSFWIEQFREGDRRQNPVQESQFVSQFRSNTVENVSAILSPADPCRQQNAANSRSRCRRRFESCHRRTETQRAHQSTGTFKYNKLFLLDRNDQFSFVNSTDSCLIDERRSRRLSSS